MRCRYFFVCVDGWAGSFSSFLSGLAVSGVGTAAGEPVGFTGRVMASMCAVSLDVVVCHLVEVCKVPIGFGTWVFLGWVGCFCNQLQLLGYGDAVRRASEVPRWAYHAISVLWRISLCV